jgi:uncharacterized protein (DUF2237 family)
MEPCNLKKITGWKRNGYCQYFPQDEGNHTICAVVTNEFLNFTLSKGNDLIKKSYNFPGLQEGDRWCLCLERWFQAYLAGVAPKIVAESSDPYALNILVSRIGKNKLYSYFVSKEK